MVNNQRYRWDFIGLSTDVKPTKATSNKVTNGSTYYESDTSKLYVWYGEQWYERKPLGGGGGDTTDFEDLSNRPKYNGAVMTGSTNIPEVETYSDFVGTDGTTAGTAGLVPAPAITDAGKFLKSDGTWSDAGGGGGATTLTSADYNYPANNPNGVALWLLPSGWYQKDDYHLRTYIDANTVDYSNNLLVFVSPEYSDLSANRYKNISYVANGNDKINTEFIFLETGLRTRAAGYQLMTGKGIMNNLTTTSADYVLDARQGKVLKDLIDSLDARVTALGG